MIFGIGCDIVDLRRLRRSLEKDARTALVRRILTDSEWLQFNRKYQQNPQNASAFAGKRFAAKEATAKALGCGFVDGLSLQDIEVINDTSGKPQLMFYNRARQLIIDNQITRTHISLSDESDYALAYVILECK